MATDSNGLVYENNRLHTLTDDVTLQGVSTIIIPPIIADPKAVIKNSIIGPHVSIGANAVIKNSIISSIGNPNIFYRICSSVIKE